MAEKDGEGGQYSREAFDTVLRQEDNIKARLDERESAVRGAPSTFDTDAIPVIYQNTDLDYIADRHEKAAMYSDVRAISNIKLKKEAYVDKAMNEAYKEDRDEHPSKEEAAKPYSREDDQALRNKRDDAAANLLRIAGMTPPFPNEAARAAMPMADNVRAEILAYERLTRQLDSMQAKAFGEASAEQAKNEKRMSENIREMEDLRLEHEYETLKKELVTVRTASRRWFFGGAQARRRAAVEAQYAAVSQEYFDRQAFKQAKKDNPDLVNDGDSLNLKALEIEAELFAAEQNDMLNRETAAMERSGLRRFVNRWKRHPGIRVMASLALVGIAMGSASVGCLPVTIAALSAKAAMAGVGTYVGAESVADWARRRFGLNTLPGRPGGAPELQSTQRSSRGVLHHRGPADTEYIGRLDTIGELADALSSTDAYLIRRGQKADANNFETERAENQATMKSVLRDRALVLMDPAGAAMSPEQARRQAMAEVIEANSYTRQSRDERETVYGRNTALGAMALGAAVGAFVFVQGLPVVRAFNAGDGSIDRFMPYRGPQGGYQTYNGPGQTTTFTEGGLSHGSGAPIFTEGGMVQGPSTVTGSFFEAVGPHTTPNVLASHGLDRFLGFAGQNLTPQQHNLAVRALLRGGLEDFHTASSWFYTTPGTGHVFSAQQIQDAINIARAAAP
jgi:hypothetical protein